VNHKFFIRTHFKVFKKMLTKPKKKIATISLTATPATITVGDGKNECAGGREGGERGRERKGETKSAVEARSPVAEEARARTGGAGARCPTTVTILFFRRQQFLRLRASKCLRVHTTPKKKKLSSQKSPLSLTHSHTHTHTLSRSLSSSLSLAVRLSLSS
jgi:hypothetical protein